MLSTQSQPAWPSPAADSQVGASPGASEPESMAAPAKACWGFPPELLRVRARVYCMRVSYSTYSQPDFCDSFRYLCLSLSTFYKTCHQHQYCCHSHEVWQASYYNVDFTKQIVRSSNLLSRLLYSVLHLFLVSWNTSCKRREILVPSYCFAR